VLEVGVVVHLHHDEAGVGLLDVDAVEALADRARGAQQGRFTPVRKGVYARLDGLWRAMGLDQLGRRLGEVEGAEAALARGAVGAILHDLPMAGRHAVLAHEQRLAREHADAPVELRGQEFLVTTAIRRHSRKAFMSATQRSLVAISPQPWYPCSAGLSRRTRPMGWRTL
jgi:hypothetical protein